MIEITPKKDGIYWVKPASYLPLRDQRRLEKELLAFGAQERMGKMTMDAWLLWNYRRLCQNSQEMPPEVAAERAKRQVWLDNAPERVVKNLSPEQWDSVVFAHLEQENAHLDTSLMGTGKSRTAIATAMVEAEEAPMLILTLKSCKYQWRDELLKLGYTGPIVILEGKNFRVPARGVVITNYDNLPPLAAEGKDTEPMQSFLTKLAPHSYLIVDEANKVQNPQALVTKRFRVLRTWWHNKGGKVLALTGTPVENKESEFWGLGVSLGMARKMFGNHDNFCKMFGGALTNRFGRTFIEWYPEKRQPEEIQLRLSTCMVRRQRKDSKERIFQDVLVDIKPNKEIDKLGYEEGMSDAEVLALAMTFENQGKIKAALAKEKQKAAMDLIEALEERGPLLVYGCSVEAVQAVGKRKGCAYIDGTISGQERARIVTAFNKGEIKTLAFSLAGCVGTNIPGAQNMVVLDLHYNDGKNKQAFGRNDRMDSTFQTLNYYMVVANHPFQIRLNTILRRKIELAEDVLGALDNPNESDSM